MDRDRLCLVCSSLLALPTEKHNNNYFIRIIIVYTMVHWRLLDLIFKNYVQKVQVYSTWLWLKYSVWCLPNYLAASGPSQNFDLKHHYTSIAHLLWDGWHDTVVPWGELPEGQRGVKVCEGGELHLRTTHKRVQCQRVSASSCMGVVWEGGVKYKLYTRNG